MEDKIIDFKEYINSLNNKKELDNNVITVDDLSLEELIDVEKLYKSEISSLINDIKELDDKKKILEKNYFNN